MNLKLYKVKKIFLFISVFIYIYFSVKINNVRNVSGDEIFSLGLANNTGSYLFFTNQEIDQNANADGWFSGQCYHNYITVQQDEKWQYGNVFDKQKYDVHPPLFYLLVHTVSSFTPEKVNYIGIVGINMIAMVGVALLLFFCMKKIYGESLWSLLPGILWLMSTACITLTNYIRMYALLSLWCMCLVYLHVSILKERKMTKERILQLAVTVTLGGLTHYYFYVFGFFLTVSFMMIQLLTDWKMLKESKKNWIQYLASYALGGMAALLIFPRVVYHVLKTDVGNQVKDNALSGNLSFTENLSIINENVFSGKMRSAILLLIVSIVAVILVGKKDKNAHQKMESNQKDYWKIVAMLVLTITGYFLLIMKITIYVAWYYISPMFASTVLLIVLLAGYGVINGKNNLTYAVSLLLILGSMWFGVRAQIPQLLNDKAEQKEFQQMLTSVTGDDCIYVSESWNCLYGNHLLDMAVMDEVRCLKEEDFTNTDFKHLLAGRETEANDVVLIFRKISEQEKYLQQIENQTGTSISKIWNDEKNTFYLLKK